MSTVVFTYGRMNPPTLGHAMVVDRMRAIMRKRTCLGKIYASKSHDKKRNPLNPDEKLFSLSRCFPDITCCLAKTIFDAGCDLFRDGFQHGILVVGEDRRKEFEKILTPYLGTDAFGLRSLEVIGIPRPREAISATMAREAARDGDRNRFVEICADRVNADQIYEAVRLKMLENGGG